MRRGSAALPVLMLVAACGNEAETNPARLASPSDVTDEVLEAAAPNGDWLMYGGNYAEDRFSTLDQITKENVDQLGLVWSYDFDLRGGVETTPLVVGGVMYASGPWSVVHAIDARTGERLWRYDPGVPRIRGRLACCDVVNRGVAMYEGKIIVGTLDGRLVALDAATGEVVWDALTIDPNEAYTITGAPRVVQGLVIIGNGGAEYGVRGYVSAYDADTGEMAWRTYTVPGDPADGFESDAIEMAAATWSGEWWIAGGGGTAWDGMAYDPGLDLLYVGTGNGSPWSRNLRSPGGGDNLFLASILALRPATGEYVWHFQTTPGDHWDYTAVQPLTLADIEFDGRMRRVIMQAPKNGFFYVLDAETGEFLSGQPYITLNWADGLDLETGRPVERPEAVHTVDWTVITPAALGGHNWQPQSYNPLTGLMYLPIQEGWVERSEDPDWEFTDLQIADHSFGPAVNNLGHRSRSAGRDDPGFLIAWDPKAQEPRWSVELAGYWNGGTMTTATGLVFQGGGDGRFVAYDGENGDALWEASTHLGILGGPVTYLVDDQQYVSVAAGWGGARGRSGAPYGEAANYEQRGRLFTFAIGGTTPIPAARTKRPFFVPDLELPTDETALAAGRRLYGQYCGSCHGARGGSEGAMPNLQRSTAITHRNFERIVIEGSREEEGMPSFTGLLDADEVRLIQAYVVSGARASLAEASAADASPDSHD
ncbi:MAG: PQQ-dependent dehydrogenase, methanol/ethanol family [Gemmatimonadetes bacterium]|nr:PQQ-dependent dehydrogenase, methanol/ethanol family [Gemmatimonadota bacterium]